MWKSKRQWRKWRDGWKRMKWCGFVSKQFVRNSSGVQKEAASHRAASWRWRGQTPSCRWPLAESPPFPNACRWRLGREPQVSIYWRTPIERLLLRFNINPIVGLSTVNNRWRQAETATGKKEWGLFHPKRSNIC